MGCGGSKDQPSEDSNTRRENDAKPGDNTGRSESQPPAANTTIPADRPRSQTGADTEEKVSIKDEERERERTGEDPKEPLPAGDVGDCMLGLTSNDKISEILKDLASGDLFCDPDFEAEESTLFYTKERQGNTQWSRPVDQVPDGKQPYLRVDGISRKDVKQGILGDCWFLSSCAAVSQQEKFLKKIIPENQHLFGEGHQGLVRFRFWRFGEWVDVHVDDRLPTRDGQLIFGRCEDETEFWVPLIEKAYAKLHGSYEAMEGGQSMDALVDLTGGLAERYEINGASSDMYRRLLRANKSGAFTTCSIQGNWRDSEEANENGLVSGHAYTITKVMKIKHKMGEEKLLRIRNPWGDETEWKGSWGDNDSNWKWVDDKTKKKMELEKSADGEFWMSYKDFCQQYQEVTICTTGPDFDGDGIVDKAGHVVSLKGEWVAGENAGGSRNNLEKFATNPQYILTLTDPDEFDPQTDDPESEGTCSVIIALMQEHRRSQRHLGVKALQIGFLIYETVDPDSRLPLDHFRYNYETAKSGVYINLREVSTRFELPPGHYVIIPSTFKEDDAGSFMLRVFGQSKFAVKGPLTG